ncbi:MAG: DNA modification methylase [Desulfobacteraceae bacterium]|nr:DNA modification methylase [Desulfobacteraceae bacterium]
MQIQLETVSVDQLHAAEYNPRIDLKPDDPEYIKLVRSLDTFGCVQPLVWNRCTGNLVGGHQRFKVLVAQGAKEIPVSVVDLPPGKEKLLNLALNRISGRWDDDKLSQLLAELVETPELDVELTAFDLSEIEQLTANLLGDDGSQDAFDAEAGLDENKPTITKPGELITLGINGEHQLLCGDIGKPADVARLMGDARARLCHTDPPYGVSYDRRNRPRSKPTRLRLKTRAEKITNDDLTSKRYAAWFAKVVDAIDEALTPGAAIYIWNGHANFGLMHDLFTARGFKIASVITWTKESFCPGFGDYNEQTEFCLYGWKGRAKHRWYGPKNASTLWQVHRDRTRLYRHPTQKALELAERAIRNSSKAGEIVFDPFLGSGTTLIGAARLGRRCFGMDIEPRYCDVTVRRYIALAGEAAVIPEIAERYRVTDKKDVR